jgi:hypothetical protein
MRCIMNTKKTLVNTLQSKEAALGFCQHAVALTKITFRRELPCHTGKNQTPIAPHMLLYRNTMYYEHKRLFCQSPFDIRILPDTPHNSGTIELSSCQTNWIRNVPSFIPGFHPLIRLSTRQQFSPPRPKLSFKHTFTCAVRATLGT